MNEYLPTMYFRLDPRSEVPPYRQLVTQVLEALREGRLQPGDQLPSVRDVVGQVALNPNTVHRAYRELEHLAIAQGRSGLGTFITSAPSAHDPLDLPQELHELLGAWVERGRLLGLDDDQLIVSLRELLQHDVAAI